MTYSAKLDGTHTFEMDVYDFSPTSRAFGLKIHVAFGVEIGWNEGLTFKATPQEVTMEVGGFTLSEVDFCDLHGSIASYLALQIEGFSLEQMGITDDAAKEAIREALELEATESSLIGFR